MSPILDSIGSVKAFGWGSLVIPNSFESIATTTVGAGGAADVTFSSIPSTFKHLQIRAIHRSEGSGTGVDWLDIRFNSDSGSNYAYHYLIGDGSSPFAGANSSQSKILSALGQPNDGQPASVFGATVIDILDYASTTKNKTVRTLNGLSNNQTSENFIGLSSGLWMNNTTAISSISLFNNTSANDIAQYSHFALYGIKGA